MKKIYIQPSVKAIKIKVSPILSGSPAPGFTTTETTSTMDGRDFDFDFDDEE